MDEDELSFRMEHGTALSSRQPWKTLLVFVPARRSPPLANLQRLELLEKAGSLRLVIHDNSAHPHEYWNDHRESPIELLFGIIRSDGIDLPDLALVEAAESLAPDGNDGSWQGSHPVRGGRAQLLARVTPAAGQWVLSWEAPDGLLGREPGRRQFASKALACSWATLMQHWVAQNNG